MFVFSRNQGKIEKKEKSHSKPKIKEDERDEIRKSFAHLNCRT
jgi:hypothetical protein